MSEVKINAALVAAYRAAMPDFPTAYEGAAFAPTTGQAWGQLTNLRASADPVTLGVGGEDEHAGVFQIDVNVPEDTGTAALLGYADTLKAYFVAGRDFTYETQAVRIVRADTSPIRRVDGWLRVSVSATYSAMTTRPEI